MWAIFFLDNFTFLMASPTPSTVVHLPPHPPLDIVSTGLCVCFLPQCPPCLEKTNSCPPTGGVSCSDYSFLLTGFSAASPFSRWKSDTCLLPTETRVNGLTSPKNLLSHSILMADSFLKVRQQPARGKGSVSPQPQRRHPPQLAWIREKHLAPG